MEGDEVTLSGIDAALAVVQSFAFVTVSRTSGHDRADIATNGRGLLYGGSGDNERGGR